MTTDNEKSNERDTFERVREVMWGAPGFQRKNKTITTEGWSFLPMETWVVETIRTNDNVAVFLQRISKEGGQRLVLPRKICEAIYQQEYRIKRARRSAGAKQAMEKRMSDPNYKPFGGKQFRKGNK